MMNGNIDGQKVIALITGASRGIGSQIAIQLSKCVGAGSIILVTARDKRSLEHVGETIKRMNPKVVALKIVADMCNSFNDIKSIFISAMDPVFSNEHGNFDALLIFHNAGTIGNLEYMAISLCDQQQWNDYLNLNVTAPILLNNFMLQYFSDKEIRQRYVVNITSLLAIKPFPSFTQYSVAKAAREAYFRALAIECPGVRVLSYSPGPVLTGMYKEICEKSYDATVREQYISGAEKNNAESSSVVRRALSAQQTVKVLLELLNNGQYENGSRVDYFDYATSQEL